MLRSYRRFGKIVENRRFTNRIHSFPGSAWERTADEAPPHNNFNHQEFKEAGRNRYSRIRALHPRQTETSLRAKAKLLDWIAHLYEQLHTEAFRRRALVSQETYRRRELSLACLEYRCASARGKIILVKNRGIE